MYKKYICLSFFEHVLNMNQMQTSYQTSTFLHTFSFMIFFFTFPFKYNISGLGSLLIFFPKSNKSTISLCFLSSSRAEEPANFLAAPAPGFFSKRLLLLTFFPSGSGSKEPQTPGSGSLALRYVYTKHFKSCPSRIICYLFIRLYE